MSRRSHAGGSVIVDDEREYYVRRHDRDGDRSYGRPKPRTTTIDRDHDSDYDEHRPRQRDRVPEPEFLRADYGRNPNVGELVIREKPRDRERDRSAAPPRSVRGEEQGRLREDVVLVERDRNVRSKDLVEEEVLIPRQEYDRRRDIREEEVIVPRKKYDQGRESTREKTYNEVVYYPHELQRSAPQIRGEREEYIYYEDGDRHDPMPREDDYRHSSPPDRRENGDIRLERVSYDYRPRVRAPSPESVRDEVITPERDRPGIRSSHAEEIIIREQEHDVRKPRYRGTKEEEIIIRDSEHNRQPPRSRHEEEIIIRDRERERERPRPRERSYERESTSITDRSVVSRAPEPIRRRRYSHESREEDIIIRHKDDGHGRHDDQIVIRRNERSPSPASTAPRREPEIMRPPIHQEIITHHRHIDHGYERDRERSRTRPSSDTHDERIEIRRRGSSHGRHYDDDIIFERETGSRRQLDGVHRGRGFTDDREQNLVRYEDRDKRELVLIDNHDQGRRFKPQVDPRDRMWTEITRDLVSEEAIREAGYEYEETPDFFYVMEYLRYEDVLALVELTEDIKSDRRRRIRQLQGERDYIENDRDREHIGVGLPPTRLALPAPEWDEERVIEREIIYDGPGPGPVPRAPRGYR